VEDCALVLHAIAGPDGKDLSVIDAPYHWDSSRDIASLEIGYIRSEFDKIPAKTKPMYEAALDQLRKEGAKIDAMELPDFPAQSLRVILSAEAATAFDDLTRSGGVNQLKGQAPGDWPNSFRTSQTIPAVEYIRAMRARTMFQRQMEELMAKWDVLVSTTFSATLSATNFTGHPQCVVPCGFSDGLPQGLLFTGRLFEEGTPLRVAQVYERATEWHTKRPTLLT
jgi:Asp-tRNA(Asn)/Glu-tRNA(Gln) amidotransferase A subunit family amidase